MNTLQDTPRANRIHIGLFGKRNSGKSSLINALTGRETALVSRNGRYHHRSRLQTHGNPWAGPCVFIDTAGLDDEGDLGALRIRQTLKTMERTDIALLVCRDEKSGPKWNGPAS